MNKKIEFNTVRPFIDEKFNKNEAFVFKPNGISMLPFIKGGKTNVEIKKYEGGAKKFDVVFYVRDDGKYVMHRIISVKNGFYRICGDNQCRLEDVKDECIFATVTKVDGKSTRGGFFYLHTLWLRRLIIRTVRYVRRHFEKNKNVNRINETNF